MPCGTRAPRLLAAVVCAAVTAAAGAPARAEVRRFALLVGANRGHAPEVPLRYAETDIDAVATTLSQVAGFTSERIVRLAAPTATRVRGALVDLNLAIQEQVRAGHEAVLFVYYSGHSDAQSLHLGGTELATEELSKLMRLSPARLKVLLLDACRSGALTRVKGGRQVPPFQIGVDDQLRFEGYAVITSSAAGEDAQESDVLRSSIFTHHFLAALRGPADVNHDGLVTLGEAYAYAYEQALKTSIATVVGSQHATYDYDLRGRADPVLSDLRGTGDQGRLVLPAAGEYLVLSADDSTVLLEANPRTSNAQLMLPAAHYQVRLRTASNVYQGEVTLRAGEITALAAGALRPLPLAQVIRKGQTEATLAQGPSVGASVHGPVGTGFSPMFGVQVGWAFELPRLTLMPRLGWSTGRAVNHAPGVRHDVTELSAELTALYVFDFAHLSVAPLVSLGAAFLHQRLTRTGCGAGEECPTIEARPTALLTTVGVWVLAPLGRGFALEATGELANFYARRQRDTHVPETDPPPLGALTYRAGLALGYRY
jgi:Caspase domain